MRSRVSRFNADHDAATVLAAEAVAEALELICSVPDPVEDIEVAQAAGWLYWLRFAARASAEGESDLTTAMDLLAPVYRLHPDGVPTLISELFERNPPAAPDGPKALARLGRSLYREALGLDDAAALDRAVDLFRRAIAAAGPDHPESGRCRTNLGSALLTRFEWAASPTDLDEAIELSRAAIASTDLDQPDRAVYLSNLGNALLTRFERLGGESDLDAAINAGQEAVTGWPDHPDHALMMSNLDLALRARAAYLDREADLDKMIEAVRNGLATASPDQSGYAGRLSELGGALLARFERSGDPADLDEAVQARRDAVVATAAGDLDPAEYLSDLSDILRIRFVHTGGEQDLADAVAAGRAGLAETPAGDPGLGGRQSNLANALYQLHQRTGGREDLDQAVTLARHAVAATPTEDPNRASYLSNLCNILRVLFERTGGEAGLDEAVDVGRAAVAAAPGGHLHVAAYLGNLGAALLSRFRHSGSQPDLDEAVDALHNAVIAAPVSGPDRATMLANLGGALQVRFESMRRREDLDDAIDACRKAVLATPRDHSSRAARLSNFGAALQARFAITGVQADLDEAVAASQVAAVDVPSGHPRRAPVLSNHALVLRQRHDHTSSVADLDAAVDAARGAVVAVTPDHPDRAGYLAGLGQALGARFACSGVEADLGEALAACREGAAVEAASPRMRAVAAGVWGSLAAEGGRWQDAVSAFAAAVDLVARTVPRSLARRDQEFLLDGMGGVGSDAAACCVRAGLDAYGIELFEQGRGLLLSQALDSRADLSALTEQYPELADRFTALCTELDRPGPAAAATSAVALGNGSLPTSQASATRRATAAAFDQLIAEIRELPGFGRFLRPIAVRDLAPAQGHIVIVNVSRFGSHALILSADADATAVPLPALTPDAVLTEVSAFLGAVDDTASKGARTRAAGQRRMAQTLGWLWDVVAGPVLNRLGITGPPRNGEPWPRLWWCPSGLMSFLPLHAAGHHDTFSATTPATVIDRVVCSTTPTLRALAHAHRGAAETRRLGSDRAVVVAMPHTPGNRSDLPGAEAEVSVVRRHFPGIVSTLTGAAATHEAVVAVLPEARWAHFVCHGDSDMADPSSSHLLLADHQNHPLTVVDLARLRMDTAELAFLSACSTARPGGRLADEAIHLASAFQLAGYRHVIGTLWPIGDQHAVDIADLVYTAVTTDGDIAAAVHTATCRMRDRWPDHPSVWASHIHVGA
ncbi:CHAT domain-containing protein [Streptomyces sp. NPDC002680]|uniref:CHAT domain-containing protein n=1 Tax=Streptomyces sp. NPDC002680 TaxID=3364659 RepID=UPI0036AC1069